MTSCFVEARETGYRTLWLGVWGRNERAIAFYRRQGFRAVGTQAFPFGKEIQHDIVMFREIESAFLTRKEADHA